LRPENVLLVDDNELLLSGMKRFFEKDFVHVTASVSGEDAIINIRQRPYQVIILDINLPGINGWEVLDYIIRNSLDSSVIIITSSEDGGIRQEAIRRGAVECMGKPFGLDDLKHVLLDILSRKRHQRRLTSYPVRFGEQCAGLVCNLSFTGMFVLTDKLLECGTTLNNIILEVNEGEVIPLKGEVVRAVKSASNASPSLAYGRQLPEGLNYGLGIKLSEQPPGYSSLVNSLLI
jgi:DNA-binding response OmpR family regulator